MPYLLALILLLLPATNLWATDVKVFMKGEQVMIEKDGQSKAAPEGTLEAVPVENSTMRYASLGVDDAQKLGLEAGFFLFNQDGSPAGFAPSEAAEYSAFLSLSPGGKVLLLDAGTYVMREAFFFSFPALKPLEYINIYYYSSTDNPAVAWNGDQQVVFTSLDDGSERRCNYEPCGPTSVKIFDLAAGFTKTLLEGTPLCDYSLVSLKNGEITADKLCLPKKEDWQEYPVQEVPEKVTVKIP